MANLKELLEKATSASGAKDYQTAFEIWKSLAEQRNAEAQFNLGRMYSYGRGVKQNHKEAVKWYRLSAEQGDADAQFNLGLMYHKGQGVLQDYVLSHMWFNLAGINGDKSAVKNRDMIGERMSPSQIREAQQLARSREVVPTCCRTGTC